MELADNLSRNKISRSKFGQCGLFTLELSALIAEKTIFDLLGMLDLGEQLLPFGRHVYHGLFLNKIYAVLSFLIKYQRC